MTDYDDADSTYYLEFDDEFKAWYTLSTDARFSTGVVRQVLAGGNFGEKQRFNFVQPKKVKVKASPPKAKSTPVAAEEAMAEEAVAAERTPTAVETAAKKEAVSEKAAGGGKPTAAEAAAKEEAAEQATKISDARLAQMRKSKAARKAKEAKEAKEAGEVAAEAMAEAAPEKNKAVPKDKSTRASGQMSMASFFKPKPAAASHTSTAEMEAEAMEVEPAAPQHQEKAMEEEAMEEAMEEEAMEEAMEEEALLSTRRTSKDSKRVAAPAAAKPAAKPPAATAPKAAAAAEDSSSDDEESRPLSERPPASSKPAAEPAAKTSAAAAAAPPAAAAAEDSSSDDEEESRPLSERPPPSAKPLAKPAAPKPAAASAAAEVDDSDSDDEESRPLSERPPPSKPPAAAEDSSSDEEESRPLSERAPGGKAPASKAGKRTRAEEEEAESEEEEAAPSDPGLAIAIARAVIAAGKVKDHEAVLSALGAPVTYDTSLAVTRKAYHGLARLIHPDKLGHAFAGSSEAFQLLVAAFDALTAPAVPAASGGKKKTNAPALARSNENCYRTRVHCPRCSQQWGGAESGLQPYEYNFMMQGLKPYTCCGCLFTFGCMSAVHACPKCDSEIDYHPGDYHKQVLCGSCDSVFGFKEYSVGPVIMKRVHDEVQERQQKRHQQRTVVAKRVARSSGPVLSEAQKVKQAEEMFIGQLLDSCPRCGHTPNEDEGNVAKQRRAHLRGCTDAAAHKAYAKKQRREAASTHTAGTETKAAREAAAQADEEVMNLASHKMLGGGAGTAWQLTDKNLEKACEAAGVEGGGTREEKLRNLAAAEASDAASGGQPRLTAQSAPANLHGMSLEELRCVCAAHGMVPPEGSSVDELVALLEARSDAHAHVEGGLEEPKRLCNAGEEEEEGDADGDADMSDEENEEQEEQEEDDDDE